MSYPLSIEKNSKYNSTQKIILLSTLELLKTKKLADISFKDIAHVCDISERTIYRNFANRDVFLDHLAIIIEKKIASPKFNGDLSTIDQYVEELFASYNRDESFTYTAIQPGVYERIRDMGQAYTRWTALKEAIAKKYPHLKAREQKLISANMRFLLCASSWSYYRKNLGLSQKETVQAVQDAIDAQLIRLRTIS